MSDFLALLPYITAIVTAAIGAISWISAKKKDDASAADIISKAAAELVEHQEEDYKRLKERYAKRFDDLEKALNEERRKRRELADELHILLEESKELWLGVLSLSGQLTDHNIEPNWKPTFRILKKYGGIKE